MLIGVFGTGRNGSSLIGRLLDGLDDTYVHPVEEKFLTGFDDLGKYGRVTRLVEQNCKTSRLLGLGREVETSKMAPYFNNNSLNDIYLHCRSTIGAPSQLSKFDFKELMETDKLDLDTFVRRYLGNLARFLRPDITFKHHLFKSIETPYIEEYEQRFPDMRFVHIMRNPVPVCSSQKRSLLENKGYYASYLGYDWLSCMLDSRWLPHARFIAERQNDPRHIVSRYEDLVQDPKGEVARIAQRLGVESPSRPSYQTIFHDLDKTTWGGNPSKKGLETPKEVVANLQDLNQYDEILTQRELDLISLKTGSYLEMLGYERSSSATRLRVVLSYIALDRWEWINWSNPKEVLRGLYGIFYRRLRLF